MTFVVNPKAQMIWEYSSQFNSYCVINDVVYGANADGLFVIDSGELDDTTTIAASWSFGKLELAKTDSRVSNVYVSAAGGDLVVSLTTDDLITIGYPIAPTRGEMLHRYRAPTAKGIKGKYWQLAMSNVDGCDFRVDDISLDVAPSSRRV